MEARLAQVGSVSIGMATIEPGWRWSTSIGPLTGDPWCQVHHFSLVLSGRIGFEMQDGEKAEFGPNSLVDVPPGHDAWIVGDEPVVMLDVYGNVGDVGLPTEHQRVVTTILISDIVDSTATAGRLGDAQWRHLLDQHDRLIRSLLDRFGGQEVNTTGDGFIATFPSAIAALRCAAAMLGVVKSLGIEVRIGVNTGEVELVDKDVRGVTVHAAARIMALAGASEVLASELTRNLVAGSGLVFEERGTHHVKGFDVPITVFALEPSTP